jgi:hypothetical protein
MCDPSNRWFTTVATHRYLWIFTPLIRFTISGSSCRTNERIAPLVSVIVDPAKDHGNRRADFEATDMLFLQLALTALIDRTSDLDPTLYRRYLTMFLDGMRADRGPPSSLPVKALGVDQAQAALKRVANVNGHRVLRVDGHDFSPAGGHQFSLLVATRSPGDGLRWFGGLPPLRWLVGGQVG